MTTIKDIKSLIRTILKNKKDLSCYLFGSYAKNKANKESDVDILILFDKNRYEYKEILNLKATIKQEFQNIDIYCDPIYGYIQNINEDRSVLYRQYIGYGKHLFGDDIKTIMIDETQEEQKSIEYDKYWRAMMFDKIRTLEYLIKNNPDINDSSLSWEFLYLIVYWNAKAELTLIDRQHSLNEYTLEFIYTSLLQKDCTTEVLYTLNLLQEYRDKIRNDDYFDIEFESIEKHFNIVINKIIRQKSPYELGSELFGKYESGRDNLSTTYKQKIKDKINEKNSHR